MIGALAVGLALALTSSSGRLAAHAALPSAAFDWSVPDRLGPNGMLGVGLPVTETTATMRILNPEGTYGGQPPAGWPADFNACASQGAAKYIWTVDGLQITETTACTVRLSFSREGRYSVALTVVDFAGGRTTTTKDVNIQDWLIFGLGDSYGSGEGNPNVPADLTEFASLEIATYAVSTALSDFQIATAQFVAAQQAVWAAEAELRDARSDYDEVVAAAGAFAQATVDLAAANLELTAANAAVAAAITKVVAANAKVSVACTLVAIWWNPSGCNTAKAQLNQAKAELSAAYSRQAAALKERDRLSALVAQLALNVPVEGWEYVIGVAQARINLASAKLAAMQTSLQAAAAWLASTAELVTTTKAARQHKAESLATWQDSQMIPNGDLPYRYSQCHQSKFSGQAQAALEMERSDSKTSVTFIHLACTGAKVTEGLLGAMDGVDPKPSTVPDREAQITVAKRMSGNREVDALVTSIGGNDVGFAKIMEACIVLENCYATVGGTNLMPDATVTDVCSQMRQQLPAVPGLGPVALFGCEEWLRQLRDERLTGGLPTYVNNKLAALPGLYSALRTEIRAKWPGFVDNRMFLTEYPKVTRDSYGNLCDATTDPWRNLPGMTADEYEWAELQVGDRLNSAIANTSELGWTPVTGMAEASRLHGYCSDSSWSVRLDQSFLTQATYSGVAHPNLFGHLEYGTRIAAALRQNFYPGGVARVDGRQ
jgi:hypothetical protein